MGKCWLILVYVLLLACTQQSGTIIVTLSPTVIPADRVDEVATVLPTPTLLKQIATPTKTAQVVGPTASPSPLPTIVASSPIVIATETAVFNPTLAAHITQGIHLTLPIQVETEHFVLHCHEVDEPVLANIASQLENDYKRITSHLKHQPTQQIAVEIYPNLQSFHAAVGHQNGLEWFVGQAESQKIQIVTPLNPGPEHSYASVLQVLTHEFTHLVVDEITNEVLPAWLDEGIALYEAGQMPSSEFIAAQAAQNMPSIDALDFNVGTDTGIIYAFSYTLIEFVSREFGNDYMIEIAKTNGDFEKVFNMTELEFEQAWQAFVMAEYATPGQKSCTDNNCSAN